MLYIGAFMFGTENASQMLYSLYANAPQKLFIGAFILGTAKAPYW